MMLSHQDALKLATTGVPLDIHCVQTDTYQWKLLVNGHDPIQRIHAKDKKTLLQTLHQTMAYHPEMVSIDGQPISRTAGLPPAGGSTMLKEEYGYRSHLRDWQIIQDHPPVDESLGLFAGGVLLTSKPAGRLSYHHKDGDLPGSTWDWAPQFLLTTRHIVTRPELERFTGQEYEDLCLTGTAPEWMRDNLAQRAEMQLETARAAGLIPERMDLPVYTKVIADTGSDGYPYSNGPSIFVHGTPVILHPEPGQTDPFDGPTTVTVADGLYRIPTGYVPVHPRWCSDPQALGPAQKLTAVKFDHADPRGNAPVRQAAWITMTVRLTNGRIELAIPYILAHSDSPLGLDVLYNPALTAREELAGAMTRALWEGSARIPKDIALDCDEETRIEVDQAISECCFKRE